MSTDSTFSSFWNRLAGAKKPRERQQVFKGPLRDDDLVDPCGLVKRIAGDKDLLSVYLRKTLDKTLLRRVHAEAPGPSPETSEAFLHALNKTLHGPPLVSACRERAAELKANLDDLPVTQQNLVLLGDTYRTEISFQPFVGPRPFRGADRELFFGREKEAHEFASRIIAHSDVLLYAPSGGGKTSLVHANLIPVLKAEGCDVLRPVRVQGPPIEGVNANAVENPYLLYALHDWWARFDESERRCSLEDLASMPLTRFIELHWPEENAEDSDLPMPRVMVFDQFEELFTSFPEHWRKRRDFFQQVAEALEGDRTLRAVFVMREDFIAELDPYAAILPERLRMRFRLGRLSRDAALAAVTEPLKNTRRRFAPGAAEYLVDQLRLVSVKAPNGETSTYPESHIEPVQLQVVCQDLWRSLDPSVEEIDRELLKKHANVQGALANFYENCVAQAVRETGVVEGELRQWCEIALITSARTRATVFRGRTGTGTRDARIANEVVDALERSYVIRAELRSNQRWYELTHDRLIPPILQSNKDWLQRTNASALATYRKLRIRARRWAKGNQDIRELFHEDELADATRCLGALTAIGVTPDSVLRQLTEASQTSIREDAMRQATRLAAVQKQRAELEYKSKKAVQREKAALTQRAQALQREKAALGQRTTALAERNNALNAAREASEQRELEQKRLAEFRSRSARRWKRMAALLVLLAGVALLVGWFACLQFANSNADLSRLHMQEGLENADRNSFEAIRHFITAMQRDRRTSFVRQYVIWQDPNVTPQDVHARQLVDTIQRLPQLRALQLEAALNERVAVAGGDGWRIFAEYTNWSDVESEQDRKAAIARYRAAQPKADDGAGEHVTPEQNIVVQQALTETRVSEYRRDAARFSPAANRMVEELDGGADAGKRLTYAWGGDGQKLAVVFNLSGKGSKLRVWNSGDFDQPIFERSFDHKVGRVRFSPQGDVVACLMYDNLEEFQLSQDARLRISMKRENGGVQVWRLSDKKLLLDGPLGKLSNVAEAVFGTSGKYLAVTFKGNKTDTLNTVQVWEIHKPDRPVEEMLREGVSSLAFSPDEQWLLIAGKEAELIRLSGTGSEKSVTGRPNSNADNSVESGTERLRYAKFTHGSSVSSVAFSSDGKLVATGSRDKSAKIWKLSDDRLSAEELFRIPHRGNVTYLTFLEHEDEKDDGHRLLLTSSGFQEPPDSNPQFHGELRVWRVPLADPPPLVAFDERPMEKMMATGPELDAFQRAAEISHTGPILFACVFEQANLAVTASSDDTAIVWDWSSKVERCRLTHQADVRFARFNADGGKVVTASRDGTARVWSTEDGRPLSPPMRHSSEVTYAEFSSDEKLVVALGSQARGGRVRTFDVITGLRLTRSVAWHDHHGVNSVSRFAACGRCEGPEFAWKENVWIQTLGQVVDTSERDVLPVGIDEERLVQLSQILSSSVASDSNDEGLAPLPTDQLRAWNELRGDYLKILSTAASEHPGDVRHQPREEGPGQEDAQQLPASTSDEPKTPAGSPDASATPGEGK